MNLFKKVETAGIWAIVLLFSLGQIGRLSFLLQRINGYIFEIPVVLLMLVYTFRYRGELAGAIKRNRSTVLFAVFSIFTLILSLGRFSMLENAVAALYLVRLLYMLWFFIVFQTAVKKNHHLKIHVHRAIVTAICITLVTSIVQYFFYQDLRNLYYEGWDPHLYRMFGLFFDPVFSGAIYGLMALYIFFSSLYKQKINWFYLFCFILLAVCMLFTYSRGTYLATIIVMVLFLLRTKKPLFIIPLVVIMVLGVILLPKKFGEGVNLMRISTVYARFADAGEGIEIGMANPLLGVGYNHIRAVKKTADDISANGYSYSHAGASFHSSYVTILATEGIIGLLLFAALIYSWGRMSEYAQYAITFVGILSLTDNVFLYPFVLLFLILTICYNAGEHAK